MPSVTYEELLIETLPSRIETDEQAEAIGARFGELLGRPQRTETEERLMNLLGVLIQDHDRRTALPPDDSTPAEMLQFMLEQSGKTPADLVPLFGAHDTVDDAIAGTRPISAEEARELGTLFGVNPGLFI